MEQENTDPEKHRPAARGRPIWKRILTGVFAILTAGFLLVLFLLKSQMMSGWRQQTGATLAKSAIGVEAQITGDVQFDLYPEFSAEITGLAFSFKKNATPDQFDQTIGKLAVSMPYSVLLGAGGLITSVEIAETRLQLDAAGTDEGDPSSQTNQQPAPFIARLPSILLGPDFVRDVTLTAMEFNFKDPLNGWSQKVVLQDASWKVATGNRIESTATGAVNDVPVSMTLGADSTGATRNLTYSATAPGLDLGIKGTIDPTTPVAEVDVEVTGQSGSLKDLASIFEVKVIGIGNGQASLHLAGPLTKLDLTDLNLKAETGNISDFTLAGEVTDLSSPRDVRLDFDAELVVDEPKSTTEDTSLLDFSIEGLSGSITGTSGDLSLENGTVRTNLATVGGNKIGPISVGRVVKNDSNRIGLKNVMVQYGPPDHPLFVVQGDVEDILSLSGLDLDGKVEIPVVEMLKNRHMPDPDALGVLVGSIAVTDASGSIRLKELKANVTGSQMIDMKIAVPSKINATGSGTNMSVKLAAPDLGEIANLLGNKVDNTGPFAFDGTIDYADATVTIEADMSFLNSDLNLNISTHEANHTAVVDGSVKASALDTGDIAVLVDTFRHRPDTDTPPEAPEKDDPKGQGAVTADPDLWNLFQANIAFEIEKLLDGADTAGNLSGQLSYTDKKLDLTGVSVTFLGGTILGDYSGDFSGSPPSYAAKGKVEKWRLGTVLSDFVHDLPVSGTLYMTYDITASGQTVGQMAKTLTGSFYASLWSGTVKSRLLDLTGLNMVTWLFGKGSGQGHSKLVCARLPLHFNDGTATGKTLIIETEDVQIVGGGSISLKKETLNLSFVPRAKVQQAIEIVSPFSISGTFSSPKVALQTPAAARAVGETLALPFNILGQIVTKGATKSTNEKPCTLPKPKSK